ncbi:hypothetical protein TWF696_007824 [Orbilia brochopaga]|uniref:Mitochondrial division protein 1 n=1 Tax=Orbilia brochopaga TaxID=3140254 RepID=A0AAV9UPQ1_9PEZI
MDPLSVTASIIALCQGIGVCWKVYSGVKDANQDIERLQKEVTNVEGLIERVEELFRSPSRPNLSESKELKNALQGCHSELQRLKDKLGSGERKFLKVVKTRAKVQLGDVNRKLDFGNLPVAEGAFYGSFTDRHEPECLLGTRTDLLKCIAEWVKDPHGKCIFWLHGAAGAGKSTISRTVAKNTADQSQLAASFFFKRGEKDRGNASRLFTTLASQIAYRIRDTGPIIQSAIDTDPSIGGMRPAEQFDKLIFQPLSQLRPNKHNVPHQPIKAVFVIDALDECDGKEDQRLIISLLGRLTSLKSVDMRVFLTSRPELPLRLGFSELSGGTHRDMILHEAPGIKHDIALFIEQEFMKIRKHHSLPSSWPGDEIIQKLVCMSVPLFIFAATACLFIGSEYRDPDKSINIVMKYQTNLHTSGLGPTYFPVLDPLATVAISDPQNELAEEFRVIVGTILSLMSPLSIPSLSGLLSIPERTIDRMLKPLHSVLDVPSQTNRHAAVRMFHLSFRDFLFNQSLCDVHKGRFKPFWINDKEAHGTIYRRCIELMASPEGLQDNICGLSIGTLQKDVDKATVEKHLTPELRYACRYWLYHLEQSADKIDDGSQVYTFLQKHLLNWFEIISLSDEMSAILEMINTLDSIVDEDNSENISAFVHDIKRFAIWNQYIIGKAPLQTYYSALIFAPKKCKVRCTFKPEERIEWMSQLPRVPDDWSGLLKTIRGHTDIVSSVAFLPRGRTQENHMIRLWDTATVSSQQLLSEHTDCVTSIAFSHRMKTFASVLGDYTIQLWDAATGSPQHLLDGHTMDITSMEFSPDGKILASASRDSTMRLWDVASGSPQQLLIGNPEGATSMAFSPDGKTLASASRDSIISLWDVATGSLRQSLDGHTMGVVDIMTFTSSYDGKRLISISRDLTVRLWDVATGSLQKLLPRHPNMAFSVALSPNGKLLASARLGSTVWLRDTATGAVQKLNAHTNLVPGVAFSPDSKTLTSDPRDHTVKLRDVATITSQHLLSDSRYSGYITAMGFSPDGKMLASVSSGGTTLLWDTATGTSQRTLLDIRQESGYVRYKCTCVALSTDGKMFASSDGDIISLKNMATGTRLMLGGYTDGFEFTNITFSPDNTMLASLSEDEAIKLWDVATGKLQNTFSTLNFDLSAFYFSKDGHNINTNSHSISIKTGQSFLLSDNTRQDEGRDKIFLVKDEWSTRNGERLIWLPRNDRPTASAVHHNTIAVGHDSGNVSFFTFSDSNIHSQP